MDKQETGIAPPRATRVRTVNEPPSRGSSRGSSGRSRDSSSRRGSNRGRSGTGRRRREPVSGRPGARKPSGSARFFAPIALIVVAIACFAVVASTDSNKADRSAEKASSTEKSSTTEAQGSNGSVTVTTKKTYTVKAGDSFAAIAEKLNIDVDTLAQLNSDVDPRALQPGQKLKLR